MSFDNSGYQLTLFPWQSSIQKMALIDEMVCKETHILILLLDICTSLKVLKEFSTKRWKKTTLVMFLTIRKNNCISVRLSVDGLAYDTADTC